MAINFLNSPPQIPALGVGMGHAGGIPAPAAMQQMMSSNAASSISSAQYQQPTADKWRATIEKTEDGYILEMAKFGGAEKKFIAKDIDELKDKIVSSMVLTKMKDK